MKLHVLSIDLGKTVFHLGGLGSNGQGGSQEKFSPAAAGLFCQCAGAVDWHGSRAVLFWARSATPKARGAMPAQW